jgi:DNA-damage-inducible protein J
MSAIHIRVDDSTKKSAKKIFKKMGLDMSTAIKLYLHQVVLTKGIPFRLVTENGLTVEEEQEILKASEDAKNDINSDGPFSTAEEVQTYLDSLK